VTRIVDTTVRLLSQQPLADNASTATVLELAGADTLVIDYKQLDFAAAQAILHYFGVSPTAVDSISIAFLVSLAVFIPASGWLGDRFGGKRVLLTAIAIFSVASALCGVA